MAKSTEDDYELQGLRRQHDRRQKEGPRGPFTTNRAIDAGTDVRQLKVVQRKALRDPSSGLFYFVVGYSKVGGPDITP